MVNKGPWQKEEDQILREQVEFHQGANAWGKIAEVLGSRSAKQCRERWHQNIKPGLNHSQITEEEARFIIHQVQTRGKRWAEISRQMENRSDNMIKNWWNGSNNRRAREHCDPRRPPHNMPQAYPLHMQQPLPSFQPAYPPIQVPTQHQYVYNAPLPYTSPVTPTMFQPAEAAYYRRDPQPEYPEHRHSWNQPSLQIDPSYHAPEQRRSMSSATTPSQPSPVTPSNNIPYSGGLFGLQSSSTPSFRDSEGFLGTHIKHSSSRRGSTQSDLHGEVGEHSTLPIEQAKDSKKSTMSISSMIN